MKRCSLVLCQDVEPVFLVALRGEIVSTKKNLYFILDDLEKSFDQVPRDDACWTEIVSDLVSLSVMISCSKYSYIKAQC